MTVRSRVLDVAVLASLTLATPALAQWIPNGRQVSPGSGVHRCAGIVADGTGGAYVVWQERSGAYPHAVHASRLLANGTTASGFPLTVAGPGGDPLHLGAGGDGGGGIAVAWGTLNTNQVQLMRLQADGTAVPGWPAGGNSYTLLAYGQAWTADGLGGGWFHYRWESAFCPHPPQCSYSSTAYARHVDAAGVLNAGDFIIAYSNYLSGASGIIRGVAPGSGLAVGGNENGNNVSRVDAAHQLVWWYTPDMEHSLVHASMGDGSGGALLVTEGSLFGPYPIRLLRIAANGGFYPGWPVAGAAIRIPDGPMGNIAATTSGDGSAVVGWTEYDPGGTKLKVQKVTAAGVIAAGWPNDGLVLCDVSGDRNTLVMAPDGAGGAVLAWKDMRSESAGDIYATHVTAAGTVDPAYAANGTGIATVPGGFGNLMLTPVGGGDAILAWTDLRTGSEVYAQKLPLPGSASVGNGSRGLALAGFIPNPASAQPRVAFTLASAGDASLELFDLGGRRVHAESWPGLAAGPHQLSLAPARPLAPGLYMIRVRAGGEQVVRRGMVGR